jgi:hypothetical protein
MWAKIENEVIRQYSNLPENYLNIIGFNLCVNEIHEQHGFFMLKSPEFDPLFQELGELYFDAGNRFFTFLLTDRVLPTIEDAKNQKIAALKDEVRDLHRTIQWYVQQKQIDNETIPTAIKNKIKSIRTNFEETKAQINSLTTVVQVIKFQLPYAQIATLRSQLESIE